MSRKQKLGLAAFILVFLLAACLVSLQFGAAPPEPPSVRLSDGRLIRLEAISYGTSHELKTTTPGWMEKLQRLLPFRLSRSIRSTSRNIKATTSTDTLVPFLSIDPSPGGKRPDWSRWRIVSDSGEVFSVGSWRSGTTFNNRPLTYPRITVFPRRDPFLTLTGTVDQLPFAIRIPNPAANQAFPVWTPGPLNATNRHDGYEFVLGRTEFYRYAKSTGFSASVDIYKDGKQVNHWFRSTFMLRDATGNEGWRIPTNEPAWRIDFTLSRQFPAPWQPHEFLDLPLENIPTEAQHRKISFGRVISGLQLGNFWIGGPGQFTMTDGAITNALPPPGDRRSMSASSSGRSWTLEWTRSKPWLLFEMPPLPKDVELTVFLIDAQGKAATARSGGGMSVGPFRSTHFDLILPKDSRPPFTLRLAVQINLHTTFTIDPAQVPRIDRTRR